MKAFGSENEHERASLRANSIFVSAIELRCTSGGGSGFAGGGGMSTLMLPIRGSASLMLPIRGMPSLMLPSRDSRLPPPRPPQPDASLKLPMRAMPSLKLPTDGFSWLSCRARFGRRASATSGGGRRSRLACAAAGPAHGDALDMFMGERLIWSTGSPRSSVRGRTTISSASRISCGLSALLPDFCGQDGTLGVAAGSSALRWSDGESCSARWRTGARSAWPVIASDSSESASELGPPTLPTLPTLPQLPLCGSGAPSERCGVRSDWGMPTGEPSSISMNDDEARRGGGGMDIAAKRREGGAQALRKPEQRCVLKWSVGKSPKGAVASTRAPSVFPFRTSARLQQASH